MWRLAGVADERARQTPCLRQCHDAGASQFKLMLVSRAAFAQADEQLQAFRPVAPPSPAARSDQLDGASVSQLVDDWMKRAVHMLR
jgi:hypothetical protein